MKVCAWHVATCSRNLIYKRATTQCHSRLWRVEIPVSAKNGCWCRSAWHAAFGFRGNLRKFAFLCAYKLAHKQCAANSATPCASRHTTTASRDCLTHERVTRCTCNNVPHLQCKYENEIVQKKWFLLQLQLRSYCKRARCMPQSLASGARCGPSVAFAVSGQPRACLLFVVFSFLLLSCLSVCLAVCLIASNLITTCGMCLWLRVARILATSFPPFGPDLPAFYYCLIVAKCAE